MKWIQNLVVGFVVSFLGSLPLGFINLLGFEVYSRQGLEALILYILGTICVEAFVVYYTLVFAHQLMKNKKLIKFIEVFGIFFLLFLAVVFYLNSSEATHHKSFLDAYLQWPVFLLGVFLCSLNFLQIPFWLAWNLYFLNANYISTYKSLKMFYVAGAMLGVFLGMLFIICVLDKIYKQLPFFTDYFMSVLVSMFFVFMAGLQSYKVYKKYFSVKILEEENEVNKIS